GRIAVRAREHDAEPADGALRDEHLRAVDDPRVAVATRRRAETGRVAPRSGLGERPRGEPLALRRLREVLLLQRLAPERQDVSGAEAVVRGDGEGERSVRARDLF